MNLKIQFPPQKTGKKEKKDVGSLTSFSGFSVCFHERGLQWYGHIKIPYIRKRASRLFLYFKRIFTSLLWSCCIPFFRCFSYSFKRWQTSAHVYPEWTRLQLSGPQKCACKQEMHWYFLVNYKCYEFSCLEDLFQLNTFTLIQSICDVLGSLQRCFIGFNSGFWLVQSRTFTVVPQTLLCSPGYVFKVIVLLDDKPSAWSAGQRPEGTQYSTTSKGKTHVMLHC